MIEIVFSHVNVSRNILTRNAVRSLSTVNDQVSVVGMKLHSMNVVWV